MQLYEHGEITNSAAIGGAALQGAITGGAAGLSGGTSLLATGAIGAGANVIGGAASNAIQGKEITAGSVTRDAAIGAGAAVGGALVGKAVASLRTGSVNLEARATTIQNSQPNAVARNRSTTASAEIVNTNGSRQIVVASSRNRLTPAQRSALKSSEREVFGKGHAEATIVNYAESTGASVRRIAASRPICENCQGAIQSTGAKVESSLKRTANQNN